MLAFQIFIFIAIILSMAYFRVPALIWTITIGVTLIILSIAGSLGFIFLFIAFIIYLAAAAFANLATLRKQYFTKPAMLALEKRMPPMSSGERDAIEAGDVWWEKELFCGKPNWNNLLQMPKPQLSSEEQSFLENQVETLCHKIHEWDVIQNKNLSEDTWDYLKKERFLGLVIPKEYGGLGFSAIAHSSIVMKIASRCMSAAVNTMVPNSLGPAELILHYGTQEQKDYYLPRLASGEEIPSFALTAPEAGSDAASITDNGIVCHGMFEGQQMIGIRLTWDKRYITLAPVATVLGIAFRMYDPDHLLSDKVDIGITLGLIPTQHPGVEIGTRHIPMGLGFMNGPTRGKDVFIPMDWIIGGVTRAGYGWRMIMESLAIGRAISLPALSTACGKLTYRMTGAYARLRKQFNVPISQFEGIEEALSDIAGYTYTLEAARMMTAGAVDQKVRPAIASAIAKYHMTELSRKVLAHAMDVHAGQMIQMGPRNFLAAKHFSIPISITVEGANILTRSLIIFGQGAIRCHPYIQREVELLNAKNAENNLDAFD
ncbi:MAG TPA: acyl-CoA dehydrogenase, partial [Gammaproteobacteria bacterium]|nr:acyl-CoA dehydrogenase [Gammaproteobacteria bacterium]